MCAWRGWESVTEADLAPQPPAAEPVVRRIRRRAGPSKLEQALLGQLALLGVAAPEREVCLIPGRKYRFDMIWAEARLAVEVQGGTWSQGAHSRGGGQARDCEKAALATLLGWRCLAVTVDQVRSGAAAVWIQQALALAGPKETR